MEKAAKTRSRAKAAVPSAPIIVTQPEPEPPAQAIVAKKVRKTKKKKSPTAAPVDVAPTTIISTASITTEPLKSDETANPAPKKRTKRLKAQEIVAEIEQQEKPEESAIVSLLEESTKLAEATPAKKTKKSVGRKGGRKKKEVEEKPVETTKTPARPIPIVVEAPKTVEAPITTPSVKKLVKKRGRKAAQAADRTQVVEPEQQQPEPQQPEPPQPAMKVVAHEVGVVIATKTPKQAQETVQQAPLSRTRTRTRTQTRVEPVAKPTLNTTQDLPSDKPAEQPAKPEAPPVVVNEKAAEPTPIVEQQQPQTSKAQQAPSTPSEAPPSAKKPKVGGGARIVRPKETVSLVKAIPVGEKEEKVELEKKVVEIGKSHS